MDMHWYALYTRSNFEAKTSTFLEQKYYHCFYPQIEAWNHRTHSRKKTLRPLFPGYIFINTILTPETWYQIMWAPGVVKIVGRKNVGPEPIPDIELFSVTKLLNAGEVLTSHTFLLEGARVRIVNGPFEGAEGFLIRRKGKKDRLVVSIEMIGRSIAVELKGEDVIPIHTPYWH